ncbi:TetR/AcrR family transcriptional regulator [Mesobacillus jeotgali]|uniref:TetR/AcrR family transcriptional regulator n=1 Tax=Mesobacillus jeotgali TaxID=129985 RepID=A0ABY9VQX8_9BACI|nr:TetR/AcrR family transcriptional regulator [Mesobacillus jeotgali]WNF25060.1 TetR/AcrR family transcriptional regulator [Mesobacillus jeotgali]
MKEKITEHSIKLFEKKGFSETSIQDIVDSIGVTKGSFYYYFSSKEELLMDIHLRYIDELLARQEEILLEQSTSKQKLYDIVYMLISSIKSKGASAKIFFREMRHLSDDRLAQIVAKRDQFRLNVELLIRKGIDSGEFRQDLNPIIVTFGILGAANWSYQWFNPMGKVSDREVAEIFVEMILKGIEVS